MSCVAPVLAQSSEIGVGEAEVVAGPDQTFNSSASVDEGADEIPGGQAVEASPPPEAEDAWLHSPEAVRQRRESRTAFDDLTAQQAEAVLSAAFSETLAQLDGDPARLLSEMQIEEVVDTYGALIPDPEGGRQLVELPIPVRETEPDGDVEPVDVALRPSEGGFRSKTPAGEVELPAAVGGEVRLGKELGIAALPGRADVAATRFGDTDLFAANSDTDTDTFIAPLTAGVEVFEQLRSPRSPERFRFALSLPKGATLRSDGQGGAEVLDSTGKRIAFVPAPYALDAQGTSVPVALAVEGNAISLGIAHRSLDVAYPILLDPQLVVEEWYWNGGNTNGLSHWSWSETADYEASNTCIAQGACWTTGLYARSKGNNYWYGPNTWGQWLYKAPNTTAYISRAVFHTLQGAVHNCNTPHPHGYVGIYNDNTGSFDARGVYSPLNFYSTSYDTGGKGGVGTRKAVVGIGTANAASQLACGHDFYAGGATIYQDDPELPTITSVTGYPTGWVKDKAPFTITANVSDPGLGVQGAVLSPDENADTSKAVNCTGLASSRCPANHSFQFQLSADSFDEGEKEVRLTATDATKKTSLTTKWKMKVDRTPPNLVLGGQLAEATHEDVGEEKDKTKWDALKLPVYNLKIEATDGSSASAATKRSGVKSVEVFLDEKQTPEQTWTQSCPSSSCPMNPVYTLALNELSALEHHTLRVVVKDFAGNEPRERKIEFEYVPATGMSDSYVLHHFALPNGQGDESEEEDPVRPELAVNVVNGNLVYRQLDVDVEGAAVDLEVERYYNSLLPASQDTEWGEGWTLAQTPELELEEPEAPGPATEATITEESGMLESAVDLPEQVGEEEFDPTLQATVAKEAGGVYELADATGESETAIAFDAGGEASELRTPGYAEVDYTYEGGELAEIAVDDPASTNYTPAEAAAAEVLRQTPAFLDAFGSAGTGPGQFEVAGDIGRTPEGDFWVADPYNHRLQKLDPEGTQLDVIGQAGDGKQLMPNGLAVDSEGNVLMTDSSRHLVEVFDSDGDFVRRFGGGWGPGPGQFRHPQGIALDPDGDVVVADMLNGRLQEFTASGELIRAVGAEGSGPGQLDGPADVAVAPDGTLWIADFEGHDVEVLGEDGDFIRSFGSWGSEDGQFRQPVAIALDTKGRPWVADQLNNRVQQFDSEGTFIRGFGSPGQGEGQFDFGWPVGIVVEPDGTLWVTDGNNDRVQAWRVPGEERLLHLDAFGSAGTGPGQFEVAGDIGRTPEGDFWVADPYNHRLQKLDPEGTQLDQVTQAGDGKQLMPNGLAVDTQGNVLMTDSSRHLVEVFDSDGDFVRRFGGGWGTGPGQFRHPQGIALDSEGDVLVADMLNGRLQEFTASGELIRGVGTEGSGPGQLDGPADVAVAPDGTLWVADFEGHDVEVLEEDGDFVASFGSWGSENGQFKQPVAIALDAKGRPWVADQLNNRVQQFDSEGTFIRGFGSPGQGQGQFDFGWPVGIVVEADGTLWVTDGNNDRVQKWRLARHTAPGPVPPLQDDPAVEIEVEGDLVEAIEGEEAGEIAYEHDGDLLTSVSGPEGETAYEYAEAERLTEVTLPDGTKAEIEYEATYGRVKAVTIDLAGSEPAKTTHFAYTDDPRRTTVTPPDAPVTTYDIGPNGSVLKWSDSKEPPLFDDVAGTLYDTPNRETATPIAPGTYNLLTQAYSPHGVASIEVIANNTDLVSEKHCSQDPEKEGTECQNVQDEWVTETSNWQPGIVYVEALLTDRLGQTASERFWVNIPYTPPPEVGSDVPPRFGEVLRFREGFGLDLDLKGDELAVNDRIFDLIGDWHNPHMPEGEVARATADTWGVPLRAVDAAEMERREAYIAQAATAIPQWASANAASSAYGGYYVDHRKGGLIYVGFTASQGERVAALKQAGGLFAPDRIRPFPQVPAHSLSSLESLLTSVVEAGEEFPRSVFGGVQIDVEHNQIAVGATNVNEVGSFLRSQFGQSAPIAVHFESLGERPSFSRIKATPTGRVKAGEMLGSLAIGAPTPASREYVTGECSAGWGAWDIAGTKPDGKPLYRHFITTAGHCFVPGTKVMQWEMQDGVAQWERTLGYVRRYAFTKHPSNFGTDAEAIRVEDPGIVPRVIRYSDDRFVRISGSTTVKEGMVVCRAGQYNPVIKCNEAEWPPKCERWGEANENGDPVLCTIRTTIPIAGGSSGGPYWERATGKAVGTLTGGIWDASWFTPLEGVPGYAKAPGSLRALGVEGQPLRLVRWR